jgi:5S rRNA maturation endonuclease (ribonuclease M5)
MEIKAKRKLLQKTERGLDDCVVIVEGKRDESALRETLAPNAKIVRCGGKSADAVASHAVEVRENGKQKIVVLTDFDEEGERRASEVREALLALGVAPDAALRRNFVRLLGVRCVEDAPCALARLEEALEKKRRLKQEAKEKDEKGKETRKTNETDR